MAKIVNHPALRTNPGRLIRACRAEIEAQRDHAVWALDQAVSALASVDLGHQPAEFGRVIYGLQAAMGALSSIDPTAPPDPALLAELGSALERLARLAAAVELDLLRLGS